jgi:hypothetical protein
MPAIDQSRVTLKLAYLISGASEDTPCFGADISFDGTLIAKSANRGVGGSTDIRPLPGIEQRVDEAEAFAKSLSSVPAQANRSGSSQGDEAPLSLGLLVQLIAADELAAGTQFC